MPEYLTPGTYTEEKSGARPIEGVGTAVAAFIGFAPAGEINQLKQITSWEQYVKTFGKEEPGGINPHLPGAFLSYAVAGFFENGGGRCYVIRVAAPTAVQTQAISGQLLAGSKQPLLTFTALQTPAEDIEVTIHGVKSPSGGSFKPGRYTIKITPIDGQGNRVGGPYEVLDFVTALQDTAQLQEFNTKNGMVKLVVDPGLDALAPEQCVPQVRDWTISQGVPSTGLRQIRILNNFADNSKRVPLFTVDAPPDPNAPALKIEVKEAVAPQVVPVGEQRFTLQVKMGELIEQIRDVSLGRRNNVEEAVARQSVLVQVKLVEGVMPTEKIEDGWQVILSAPKLSDLQIEPAHITGENDGRAGLAGLKLAEDVTIICCPDLMAAFEAGIIDEYGVKRVQAAMIAHCESPFRRDRIAILDTPLRLSPQVAPMDPQEAKAWRMDVANFGSPFAAMYYPWVKVMGPGKKLIAVPPCGHIAGIWARNDRDRGVHKAPANEELRGIVGLAVPVSFEEQGPLNKEGINCLRSFPGKGVRVWGARTMSSDPQWTYINVRRLFNYIEKSIERSTQWVVFEPNDYDLWARVKRDISAFLTSRWRAGMLFGRNPEEAFFVICDERNNPAEERAQGRLFVDIGLAPSKPAEFVVFRYSQFTDGGE